MHSGVQKNDSVVGAAYTKRRRTALIAGFVLVIIAAAIGAAWLLLPSAYSAKAVLVQAQKKVSFALYYPATPPDGFLFDEKSVSATGQVVLYSYTYDGSKKLLVTTQSNAGVDTNQFKPTSDFTTTIGRAYVVDLDERTTAAVVTDKSWLIINAPDKIAVDKLTQFINSLRPVQ